MKKKNKNQKPNEPGRPERRVRGPGADTHAGDNSDSEAGETTGAMTAEVSPGRGVTQAQIQDTQRLVTKGDRRHDFQRGTSHSPVRASQTDGLQKEPEGETTLPPRCNAGERREST